jgi:hypothetical protein
MTSGRFSFWALHRDRGIGSRRESPPQALGVAFYRVSTMATYRAYLVNPAGKIVWGEWIESDDLKTAKAKAHALCSDGIPTVELWQGTKRVAELPCAEVEG